MYYEIVVVAFPDLTSFFPPVISIVSFFSYANCFGPYGRAIFVRLKAKQFSDEDILSGTFLDKVNRSPLHAAAYMVSLFFFTGTVCPGSSDPT